MKPSSGFHPVTWERVTNSFDENYDLFITVILKSHPKKNYALFVHFGSIEDWFFCGIWDSLVEKVSLVFKEIPSNLLVSHASNPLKMVSHWNKLNDDFCSQCLVL